MFDVLTSFKVCSDAFVLAVESDSGVILFFLDVLKGILNKLPVVRKKYFFGAEVYPTPDHVANLELAILHLLVYSDGGL